jgi:hypothetical protein
MMLQASLPQPSAFAAPGIPRKRRLSTSADMSSATKTLAGDEAMVPQDMRISEAEMMDVAPIDVHVPDSMAVVQYPGESSFQALEMLGRCTAFGIDLKPREQREYHPFFSKTKEEIVRTTVQMLTAWLDSNTVPDAPVVPSIFNGKATVTLQEFTKTLLDLIEHLRCGNEVFLATFIYLRRVHSPSFSVTWSNVFRLLLAAVLAGVKYLDDYGLPNRRYARLIGLEATDICELESSFCHTLKFSLYIYEEEFMEMCTLLT